MKKSYFAFMLLIALGLVLTACSGSNSNANTNGNTNSGVNQEAQATTTQTTKEIVDAMLAKIEQPALMEMPAEMVSEMYHLAPSLLEEYTIMTPMMNVKTNEIAVLKVKDAKDIAAVEEGLKQRAADVQKQFETYLPDQYENAQNYKLLTKGNYVLFVISDQADNLVKEFETFFEQK